MHKIFVYTGAADPIYSAIFPPSAPVDGERCVVQTLTSSDDTASGTSAIADVDGDSCHDVLASSGNIETTVEFEHEFSIPCTDYSAGDSLAGGATRTVKLQFCSTWRTENTDADCDASGGPFPRSGDECSCWDEDLGIVITPRQTLEPSKGPTRRPTPVPTPIVIVDPKPVTRPPAAAPTPSPVKISIDSSSPTSSPIVVPFAVDDSMETCVDTPASLDVTLNDRWNEEVGNVRPLRVKSLPDDGRDGRCTLGPGARVTYLPDTGFVGNDACIYEACESDAESGEWIDRGVCVEGAIVIVVHGQGVEGCQTFDVTSNPTRNPSPEPTAEVSNASLDEKV